MGLNDIPLYSSAIFCLHIHLLMSGHWVVKSVSLIVPVHIVKSQVSGYVLESGVSGHMAVIYFNYCKILDVFFHGHSP